jgi:hypothetical protein
VEWCGGCLSGFLLVESVFGFDVVAIGDVGGGRCPMLVYLQS